MQMLAAVPLLTSNRLVARRYFHSISIPMFSHSFHPCFSWLPFRYFCISVRFSVGLSARSLLHMPTLSHGQRRPLSWPLVCPSLNQQPGKSTHETEGNGYTGLALVSCPGCEQYSTVTRYAWARWRGRHEGMLLAHLPHRSRYLPKAPLRNRRSAGIDGEKCARIAVSRDSDCDKEAGSKCPNGAGTIRYTLRIDLVRLRPGPAARGARLGHA